MKTTSHRLIDFFLIIKEIIEDIYGSSITYSDCTFVELDENDETIEKFLCILLSKDDLELILCIRFSEFKFQEHKILKKIEDFLNYFDGLFEYEIFKTNNLFSLDKIKNINNINLKINLDIFNIVSTNFYIFINDRNIKINDIKNVIFDRCNNIYNLNKKEIKNIRRKKFHEILEEIELIEKMIVKFNKKYNKEFQLCYKK